MCEFKTVFFFLIGATTTIWLSTEVLIRMERSKWKTEVCPTNDGDTCSKEPPPGMTTITYVPDPLSGKDNRETCSTNSEGTEDCFMEYQQDDGTWESTPQFITLIIRDSLELLLPLRWIFTFLVPTVCVLYLGFDILKCRVWKLAHLPPGTPRRNKWYRYFCEKLPEMF